MPKSLQDTYKDLKSAEALQDLFDGMGEEEKHDLLLVPLSPETDENTLSYMVSYRYFVNLFGRESPHSKEFTTTILNEIEKITTSNEERVNVLISANYLGQTIFHKALRNLPLFKELVDRLYKWADPYTADVFLKGLLDNSLGQIDYDTSYTLQDIRDIRPYDSVEGIHIQNLCCAPYKPVSFEGLKKAVDELRPLILEWLDKNPAAPDDSYKTEKNEQLRAFATDPDAVQTAGTLVTQSFPGPVFTYLLELEQKFSPVTPKEQADRIFARMSEQYAEGNALMHRSWQASTLLGPAPSAGCVTDMLGPLIASFDNLLGEEAAIALTKKLLLLEIDQGELPLDRFEYNDPMELRDYYIEAFLLNLRKELGTQEKFELYVKDAVAPVLPSDFTINLGSYGRQADINDDGSPDGPRHGARFEP